MENENYRVITYAEIKDFCNSLTEKQLQQEVKIWISDDDTPTEVHGIDYLGDDYYTFVQHNYSCKRSDFERNIVLDENGNMYDSFEHAIAHEDFYVTPADSVYMHSF